MRGIAIVVVAVLVSIGAGAGAEAVVGSLGPAVGAHGVGPLPSPVVRARLRRIARDVATENADPAARRATVVLTARQRAAGGDIVDSNPPVYELVLRGRFTCAAMCSWPPGGHAPRGDVATITIGRESFQMTDFGVGDRLPVIAPGTRTFTLRW